MPINAQWYNSDKTILYVIYEGKWSLGEYHDSVDRNAQMIREQPHQVMVVGDFSSSEGIPDNFLSSGRHSETVMPTNHVGSVLFGLSTYMTMLAKIFAKVFPKSSAGLQITSTHDDAIEKAELALRQLEH